MNWIIALQNPILTPAKGSAERARRERQRRARRNALATGRALRSARLDVSRHMETDVRRFFADWADHVVHRALRRKKSGVYVVRTQVKESLPDVDDLIDDDDLDELQGVIKRSYTELLQLSWGVWNGALGVEIAFDLDDPLVTRILGTSGTRIKNIEDTTLAKVRELLQYGSDQGWGIDHIVRGDPDDDVPGLREVVEETYQGRARTIARTELGTSQNQATTGRYRNASVRNVYVQDNGLDDDDEPCQRANGAVWTLAKAEKYPLAHPN